MTGRAASRASGEAAADDYPDQSGRSPSRGQSDSGQREGGCPQATRVAAAMFWLAVLFLVVLAVALQLFDHSLRLELGEMPWLLYAAAALWLPFVAEAALQLWRARTRSLVVWRRAALVVLLPPLRMALAPQVSTPCLWLPFVGWQRADRALFDRLERAFSVPMLFIAMMILPILAVELLWKEQVAASPTLALVLDVGTAMIWLAFAIELILMVCIAEHKLRYCARQWLNLTVILLPLVAFLRGLQAVRLLRMAKVSNLLRVYRMRGLAMRAYRGLIVLEVLERLVHRSPQARLRHLRAVLEEKEWEVERLRARIRSLEQEPGEGKLPRADGAVRRQAQSSPGEP